MPGYLDVDYDKIFYNMMNAKLKITNFKIMTEEERIKEKFTPKRIIYNNPATIVFWKDGTKTVVKKSKGEKYNVYNAFTAALAKKIFSNNSTVNRIVGSGIDQQAKKEKK